MPNIISIGDWSGNGVSWTKLGSKELTGTSPYLFDSNTNWALYDLLLVVGKNIQQGYHLNAYTINFPSIAPNENITISNAQTQFDIYLLFFNAKIRAQSGFAYKLVTSGENNTNILEGTIQNALSYGSNSYFFDKISNSRFVDNSDTSASERNKQYSGIIYYYGIALT